ncbi:lyase family protein [Yoonia sp. BS5-3]|uniref:Lyase family protein n=1 Tax=Yoonia phaeophyticola TaxID=3137369 RepID=A0ABZ2V740_9RHOB
MISLSEHPWMGGLFGDAECTTLFSADAELKRFLQIEAAWTRALGTVEGVEDAEAVAKGIEEAVIETQVLRGGTERDGLPIPALVKALKGQLGNDALIHRGLTSQDVMDTSLMMVLGQVAELLIGRLKALDQQLAALQDRFGAARLMAYTRMQPALETTAQELIGRWRQPLPRLLSDLAHCQTDLRQIQWGGPIGVRDHTNADKLGVCFAHNLNMHDPGQAWHTDRTIVLSVGGILSRITIAMGKIGKDIALMAALGPEQITLVGGGSSAMTHKNNPIKAEALISLADLASSLQSGLTRSARHEGFRSGQAWALEWLILPEFCVTSATSLLLAGKLINDLETFGAVPRHF